MSRPSLFVVALLSIASVAIADPADLKPFKATYSADWKGMSAATSTLQLRRDGADTYSYETVNTPHGLFRMALPDSLTQASTFRVKDGRVIPLKFTGTDEKEHPIDLVFDWAGKRVTGTAKGSAVDLEIPEDAQDPMSLQIESLRSLAKGRLDMTISLVDGDGKLKAYELRSEGKAEIDTALGTLETIIYTSRRAGSDRMTRTWVAPALGYLPVKAERIRKQKVEITLRIQSVEGR